jgi:hypothetical protein
MPKPRVTQRYAQILAEAAQAGEKAAPTSAMERRGAPRVPVTCGDVSVNLSYPVTTVDISTGGACFLSEQPFPVGTEISLAVASVFSLAATVVGCNMEESDAVFLEMRYRVRCRFSDEAQGMEVLVLAKERESIP